MTDMLEELEKEKQRNRKERMAFIEYYADWVKKTSNEEWSKAQNELFS